jgi:hypothetical protein
LRKGEQSNELWIVPDSEDPVSIADIRVLSVPAAGMSVALSQVNGLTGALGAKADKAETNTFTAPQFVREDAPGTSNPLLGLQKYDGSAGIYFRAPELSGDVTYTLPPNAGSPNQALTTDGSGALFWSSAAGAGGAGSGSAYEVLQQGGTSVTQRTVANFTSGFLVSDNGDQLRTDIAPNFGTAAGTITQGNDLRLSNARTPLAHASTHAEAGSDPVTPASIGALNRNNDFMVGTSPTTPVLKLQGSTAQAAALQEWRDGDGALAALITPQGNGFFREVGISAPAGGTTVSQFFEVGGLKKFALSATDSVLDILRYDNAGAFVDRPLRVLRSGPIETTVSMKVADAGIGSGALGLTGDYLELQGVPAPTNPTSGFGRLYLDSTTGELSVKKSSGSIVSLESGGGGGSGDEVAVNGSAVNAAANLDDTSTIEWTLVDGGGGADDVQASVVPDSIGPAQLDEEGTYDFSLGGVTLPSGTMFGSGSTPFNMTGYTDDAAPSAPGTANQFTDYWDRTSGLHCWILNGGSTQCALTSAQIDTFAKLDALVADKALANLVDAQTFATGTKTVTTKFDFGGGTLEAPNSTTLPGTCAVGEVYFDSDAPAGLNFHGCTATNTWTPLGGGGGGSGTVSGSANYLAYFDGTDSVANSSFGMTPDLMTIPTGASKGLVWGDGDTGWYESVDDRLKFIGGGSQSWEMQADWFRATSNNGPMIYSTSISDPTHITYGWRNQNMGLYFLGSDNIGLALAGALAVEFGGTQPFRVVQSANVASAGTISAVGNIHYVTGTTNIDTVNTCASGSEGAELTLIFAGSLTVHDGTGNLQIAGDFLATTDDVLKLVCGYNGSNYRWFEISRSAN